MFKIFLTFFTILAPVIFLKAQSPAATEFLYFTNEQVSSIKEAVKLKDKNVMPFVKALRHEADRMMKEGPWSITSIHAINSTSKDPHDYYSEGPYWWPDPKNPDGPYIRRDGLRNPKRFTGHHELLNNMYEAASYLSIAAYLLDDQKYADHASEIINTWFINEKTKMNPNLNHAQAIKGRSSGRGTGIIDTHRFSQLIEAINFLKASGKWNDTQYKDLQSWFREYLSWLQSSKNGKDEKYSKNNHATWWDAQAMACSIFLKDSATYKMAVNFAKNNLIANEIEANGSCPLEEARTKSLSYSIFNLNAFSLICRMAMLRGKDLWNYKSLKGGSVEKAVDYLLPYIKDPSLWKKQQIIPFNETRPDYLPFAYFDLHKVQYYKTYVKSEKAAKEPFSLLLNMAMAAGNH